MPTIEVLRPKGKGYRRDTWRRYKIVVDGSHVASLKEGETARLDVEAGRHLVQARIDWITTTPVEVTLSAAEIVRLLVRPGGSPWQALGQLASSEYLTVERL
jgi:hypothetical protein